MWVVWALALLVWYIFFFFFCCFRFIKAVIMSGECWLLTGESYKHRTCYCSDDRRCHVGAHLHDDFDRHLVLLGDNTSPQSEDNGRTAAAGPVNGWPPGVCCQRDRDFLRHFRWKVRGETEAWLLVQCRLTASQKCSITERPVCGINAITPVRSDSTHTQPRENHAWLQRGITRRVQPKLSLPRAVGCDWPW